MCTCTLWYEHNCSAAQQPVPPASCCYTQTLKYAHTTAKQHIARTCMWAVPMCAAVHIKQHALNKQHQHVAQGDQHKVQGVVSNKGSQALLTLLTVGQQVHQTSC